MIFILASVLVLLAPVTPVFHLPILAVIWYTGRAVNAAKIYPFAFFLGMFADLVSGNRLGVLAGSYLLTALFIQLFKTRFKFNVWPFLVSLGISQVVFFYARGLS